MFFKKKKDPVESLLEKCNDAYKDFIGHYTKAHYRNYFLFKKDLKAYFEIMKQKIATSDDETITLKLLQQFHDQLKFINKNPFSASEQDMKNFANLHLPYEEKLKKITEGTGNKLKI